MIRINLVVTDAAIRKATEGEGAVESSADLAEIQKQGAIKLLMLFLIPILLYAYEIQNIPDLRGRLNSKQTLLQSLIAKNNQAQTAVEEINKFKEDKGRLQKMIETLEGLQKERLQEVKILDNLQKDIPEKVWLTKVNFDGNRVSIVGSATTDYDLTVFMENLSKSIFLKEVNLLKSSEMMTERGVLKAFEIVCLIDRSLSSIGSSKGKGD
jgi:type IV pilus assembly protein PilN